MADDPNKRRGLGSGALGGFGLGGGRFTPLGNGNLDNDRKNKVILSITDDTTNTNKIILKKYDESKTNDMVILKSL